MILKSEVEANVGHAIPDEDYKEAESYARHKLNWQNKYFGTNYGDEYLVLLIADTYREQQFSNYTWELCQQRMREQEKEVVEC